jgi:hypothetical protein
MILHVIHMMALFEFRNAFFIARLISPSRNTLPVIPTACAIASAVGVFCVSRLSIVPSVRVSVQLVLDLRWLGDAKIICTCVKCDTLLLRGRGLTDR